MADYKKLYHIMVTAAEDAIEAIEEGDSKRAKELLVAGEQRAEDIYVETIEDAE